MNQKIFLKLFIFFFIIVIQHFINWGWRISYKHKKEFEQLVLLILLSSIILELMCFWFFFMIK